MIGKLSGVLLEKNPPEIVLECHGIGYEVLVPMSTFYQLPVPGNATSLLTHLLVREDAHVLYGFSTLQERIAFRQLIKISNVGPRTALAILSGLSVTDLNHAIATQDSARIVKVPGIGKKTAERLLLELKGKFAPDLSGGLSNAPTNSQSNDIEQALIALGYSEKDAGLALKKLPQGIDVSEGIRLALKNLAQ